MSKLAFNRTSKTLLLGWRWLLAGAIVATLIAAAYVFTRPRTYEASVDVLPDRVRTDIRLSTTIQSVSPNAAQQPSGQNQAPSTVLNPITPERRQSLALLVRNADIEAAVREELKGKLPANLTAPGQLLKLVQGRLMSHTEVIRITVETADPALSEAVASSWARAYERQVNRLYTSPTSTLDVLDSEVQAAHQKYENAQRTLDNFTGSSHLEEHHRLIERRRQLLKDMIASRQVLVADLSKVSEQVALQLGQAQALQEHLTAATDNSAAATNTAALSLLKSEVFASSAALPSNLQVQLPTSTTPVTLAQQRDDVAAMIVALRAWQDRLQLQIVSLSQEAMGSGQTEGAGSTDAALVAASRGIEAELRDLQGQASQEEAQQKDLTQNRDVTWQTYQELLTKAAESHVQDVLGIGKEVTVASQQVVAEPKSRHTSLILPLAALFGALVAATYLLARDYLVLDLTPTAAEPTLRNGVSGSANGLNAPSPEEIAAARRS